MSAQPNETGLAIRMSDLSPEYAEIVVLGNILQKSGYFKDVRDQAQAVTKILCGRELGFSPIVSLQGIHIIDGKPALSSHLMATLIKRSGKYDYRVKTTTNTECVLVFSERVIDDPIAGLRPSHWEALGESSFTIDDAKTAGVLRPGGTWSKYPKAMLFARALSQGLRTYCPDVSAAPIYNPEEMGAEVNEDGEVVDLPKGAKPVETIEKPVTFKRKESAPLNKEQGGEPQKGTHPPDGAEINSTTGVKDQPMEVKVGRLEKSESPATATTPTQPVVESPDEIPMADCINQGQAANLHRIFKDALPLKLKKQSEELLHDWLRVQGIKDVIGKPSALAIRKASFYDVREACEQHAKSLGA